MYGRQRSTLLEPLLSALSVVYRTALILRDAAYRLGLFRSRRLPVKVISVGNITLGGTGKSPAAVNIASLFLSRGKQPLLLSRGYGRTDERSIEVVSDGSSGQVLRPERAGDEPVMMAARLPGVPVVVGSDRYHAGRTAIDRFHPDVIVLDDGFQHRRLLRDLNIVLIDAADPFGNSKLFPAGILREPLDALRRADIVLITRADSASSLEQLKRTIGRHTGAPIMTALTVPSDIMDIRTGEARPPERLRGSRVFAFAGIARPEAFFALLRYLGAEVAAVREYPDHYRYTKSDLADLAASAADSHAAMIVTTEKDAVRLRDLLPGSIWALRVELEVREREAWERALLNIL